MEDSVVSPGACVQPWDAPEEPLGVGRKYQNFPFCLFAFLKVVRLKFIHGFKEVSDTCFTLVVGLILTIALGGEDYYNPHLHRKLRLRVPRISPRSGHRQEVSEQPGWLPAVSYHHFLTISWMRPCGTCM